MDWAQLIDEGELAALLPAAYTYLARPVREGLIVFLSGLPREWQDEVFARQLQLGLQSTLAQRLGELGRSCPVLHKLGQLLARDQRLAPELREQLRPLESLPPEIAWEEVQRQLRRELGPQRMRGIELLQPALAEASVAIVVAYNSGGTGPSGGVLKILKPNIEERLKCELDLLGSVGAHLDARCRELGIPELDYWNSFEQVRTKLCGELRLDHEQHHLALAKRLYADDIDVQIPRVFVEHCTPRVTAMERVPGVKVTDHELPSFGASRRLPRTIARALLSRPLFATGEAAIVHCDPHAGNLMLADDGRLAILDWSLVVRLAEPERVTLSKLALAAATLDAVQVGKLLAALSVRGAASPAGLDRVVHHWLDRLRHGQAPGVAWLIGLLDDAVQTAGLRVSAAMMLVRKALVTLTGVCIDLSGNDFVLDEALLRDFFSHFVSEWPTRWMAPPDSRDFGSRISNFDLVEFACNWPQALARFMGPRVGV
jgi:ubiquinone biosynthesis protein